MGIPIFWMVYFMKHPIKMDDLGVPLFFGNLHMVMGQIKDLGTWEAT